MNMPAINTNSIIAFVSSSKFFKLIVGLFIVQAAWIALSGHYPMAFDEDFHLGVIRLYAHHLSPFWDVDPSDGATFGAISRDPSYLYHYLMSFPYRLLSVFTDNQSLQVLILRAMNIGFLAAGLPLYRSLLLKTGASKPVVHLSLLIFVLIPIVPMLGAQINYDNAIIPLTVLSLLLAIQVSESLRKQSIDITKLLWFVAVCLFASIVKYAYLPIFVGVSGFLMFRGWQVYRRPAGFFHAAQKSWSVLKGRGRWGLIILIVLLAGLFTERYGVNLVRYHEPVPDCAQVLTYNECQHYPPWIRDYNFEATKPSKNDKNPISYSRHWIYGNWMRSFFAVDGPKSNFDTKGPLLLPAIAGAVLPVAGLSALMVGGRKLWQRYNAPALWLFSVATVLYIAILWTTQYQLYVRTAQPVAINGRYLLPVLPLLIIMSALAIQLLLGSRKRLKLILATVSIVCLMWGGGGLTYILRSNDSWYWTGTPLTPVNHVLQEFLGPITPGYSNPILFLPR